MESITSLSFYLPSNIKHEIKLEKKEQQENTDIRGSPNMGYIHGKDCILTALQSTHVVYVICTHMIVTWLGDRAWCDAYVKMPYNLGDLFSE